MTTVWLDQGVKLDKRMLLSRRSKPSLHPAVQQLLRRKRIPFSEAFKVRGKRITGTDVAVITGDNPYMNLPKWFHKKLGLYKVRSNPAMQHGVDNEPKALKCYQASTGLTLVDDHVGFVLHGECFGATPDAVLYAAPILVEVKCPTGAIKLLKGIPKLYFPQVQMQLFCTGFRRCHFVRYWPETLTHPETIHIYAVDAQPAYMKAILPSLHEAHARLLQYEKDGAHTLPPLRKVKKVKKEKGGEQIQPLL